MKSYYEKHREDSNEIVVRRNDAPAYPMHFHANVEIFIVKKGEGKLLLGGAMEKITAGQVAVIDAYETHGYYPMQDGEKDCCIVVIPFAFLAGRTKNQGAIQEKILSDEALCDELLSIIDEYLLPAKGEEVKRMAVGLLWAVLAEKLHFTKDGKQGDRALIRQILIYIQENYQGQVTRKKIAKELGYAEGHISRVFHKYLKIGISEYVNKIRLLHVESRKRAGDKRKITELVYEAGFSSQQTYYRIKTKFA